MAITALIVGAYVTISIAILIFAHWASIPSIITVAVGAVVIAIPALDLAQSLTAVNVLRVALARLAPDELDEFRKIAMRRELEARLEDQTGPVAVPAQQNTGGIIIPPVDRLKELLKFIAKDDSFRVLISPPLMQESRAARVRYLQRVWPKGATSIKSIG